MAKPPNNFGRLAKLGGLTSRVSSSYLGQRVKGVFQDRETRQRDERQLHIDNAQRVAETMGKLKGAAMKVGQQLAQAVEGMDLPPEVGGALRDLNNKAEPVAFEVVQAEIERQLERPVDELFAWIDPTPLGTASLAQAHAARLPDGTQVVVKVLHPGIEHSVDTDLNALRRLLVGSRVLNRDRREIDALFSEIRERLLEELDYYQEAANLAFFRELFHDDPAVQIPATHSAWCTDRVLTMDHLPGVPLDAFLEVASPEAKQRAGTTLARTFFRMTYGACALHADPHEGNYLFTPDGGVGILDFGCVKRFDEYWIADYARIAEAAFDGDVDEQLRINRKLGALTEDAGPEAEALLLDFIGAIAIRFKQGRVTLGGDPDPVAEQLKVLAPRFLLFPKQIHTPREVLYLHRALGGLYAMLRRLDARGDWGAMAREWHRHAIQRVDGG
jgi:predicted unusual protein kinase regulating ubiquinone biosynthesis (AarF/ABC1/UbiB family)